MEAVIPLADWVVGSPLLPGTGPTQERVSAAGGGVEESAIRARIGPACAGDASAQGELFEAYRADVTRLCQRLLASREDAEDAVHESFLRMQRGVASYDPERPFRRWLLALAAHCAIDRLRRRRREARLFDDDADPALESAGEDTPLAGELREELRRRVLAAVDTLPDRYRAPIVLRYYADLDYASIGAILGVDVNQVATLLFRGRRRLRDVLGGRAGRCAVTCPGEPTLARYADRELHGEALHALETHLVGCRACRSRVVALQSESLLPGRRAAGAHAADARCTPSTRSPSPGVAMGLPLAIAGVTAVAAVCGVLFESRLPGGLDLLNPMRLLGVTDMLFDLVFMLRARAPGLIELAFAVAVVASVSALLSFGVGALYRRVFGTAALLLCLLAPGRGAAFELRHVHDGAVRIGPTRWWRAPWSSRARACTSTAWSTAT